MRKYERSKREEIGVRNERGVGARLTVWACGRVWRAAAFRIPAFGGMTGREEGMAARKYRPF